MAAPTRKPIEPDAPDSEAHNDLTAKTESGTRVPLRLVADKSFFHDAFRTDYTPQVDAEWLWAYLAARRAVDPRHRIMVTADSILTRLETELRPHLGFQAVSVSLLIRNLVRPVYVPPEQNLGWAPLFVARILRDGGTIAIIVSSVKTDRWLQRMKDAGVAWNVEGFEEGEMADKRAIEHSWFLPLGTHATSHVLESFDPLFKRVTQLVGPPERGRPKEQGK